MALEDGRISPRQFLALLVLSRVTAMVITLPMLTNTAVGRDAWIASIISGILALPLVLSVVYLGQRFPGKTIIEYSQILLGRFFGALVGAIIVWFFIHTAATATRKAGESLVSAIMPETPIIVFILLIAFLAASTVRNGLEVLARAAENGLFLILFFLVLLLILPYNTMNIRHLFPVLARGFDPLVGSMAVSLGFYGEGLLVAGMLVPYMNRPGQVVRFSLYSIALMVFVMTWLNIDLILVFGPTVTGLALPAFSLGRMISIANFLERIEVVPLSTWLFSAGIKLALYYWAATLGISQLLGLRTYRPLVFPLGATIVSFSILFYPGVFDIADFFVPETWGVYSLTLTLGVVGILYLALGVRTLIRKTVT